MWKHWRLQIPRVSLVTWHPSRTLPTHTHWDRSPTETHTHSNHQCVSKNWRYLNECVLEWRSHLSESRSMTLPSWPQTATRPAALFYSRITRSEPGEWPILTHPPVYKPSSTAFVTGHWTQSSLSYYFITSLTCAGFWLVSSSSVFPNTSASVASSSQQPDAFWRETSWSNRSSWESGAAEHTKLYCSCYVHEIVLKGLLSFLNLIVEWCLIFV